MLLVFTGNGKGKTTAALGQAIRSIGEGKKVLMIQFIKGPWKSGEDMLVENFQFPVSSFQILKTGLGFVGIMGDTLPREEHANAAEKGLALAKKEIESGKWDTVILDEVNNAVDLKFISAEQVLELINLTPSASHLILTGRNAPKEFIDLADLVTEMREVKHPYDKGVKAQRGLEY